jgi:type IX secretion system PorP/SprF family membrane protein
MSGIWRFIIVLIMVIGLHNLAFGQDPVFSQFYANAIYYNPASSGITGLQRFFLNYRNQYPALGSAFVTYGASYDQPVQKMQGGIGIGFLSDNIANGAITNSSADFDYSHRFKASRNLTIQAGLRASFLFHSLNTSKFKVFPSENEVVSSRLIAQPDFAAGVVAFSRNYEIGLSCNHLNTGYLRFNYDYIRFPIKFSLIAIRNFHLYNAKKVNNNELIISPAILIEQQGNDLQINAGGAVTKNNLSLGFWVRDLMGSQLNSAIFSLGYTFNNLKIIYSYDYDLKSISGIMPYTGAHEISLIVLIAPDPTKGRYEPLKCPDIQN